MKTYNQLRKELIALMEEIDRRKDRIAEDAAEILQERGGKGARMTAKEIATAIANRSDEEISPEKLCWVLLNSYSIIPNGHKTIEKVRCYIECDENGKVINPEVKRHIQRYEVNAYSLR